MAEQPAEINLQLLQDLGEQEVYAHSPFLQKLNTQVQRDPHSKPLGVFADIDGTTHIKSTDPSYKEAAVAIEQELDNLSIPFVAVTGRELWMVQEMQGSNGEDVPMFDMIIGAVGTEIHVLQENGEYRLDTEYERFLREEVGFDRDQLYPVCVDMKDAINRQRANLKLEFQPLDTEENVTAYKDNSESAGEYTGLGAPHEFKISYRFNGTAEDRVFVEEQIRNQLNEAGFEKILVVISHDSFLHDRTTRYNIDILPVTKDFAIEYVVQKTNCRGVVAGDSGNDIRMIKHASDAGIVVGGAKEELTEVMNDMRQTPTLRRTQHFQVLETEKNSHGRIVYRESGEEQGPKSLRKALRAFKLLHALSQTNEEG